MKFKVIEFLKIYAPSVKYKVDDLIHIIRYFIQNCSCMFLKDDVFKSIVKRK